MCAIVNIGEVMGLDIRRILAKAGLKLDEAWKFSKKGLWLFAVTYAGEALVLLELIDDVLAEGSESLEPDEETAYVTIRTDIHNLMSEARRIGGNGAEKKPKMSGASEVARTKEFRDLVSHLLEENRLH